VPFKCRIFHMENNRYECIVCHHVTENGWQNCNMCDDIGKKYNLDCEDRKVSKATADVCSKCMIGDYALYFEFYCVVCHKRSHITFGNTHLSFKIAQIHNAIYVAKKSIILDVCQKCVLLKPKLTKSQRTRFWNAKIKGIIVTKK